MPRIDDIIGNDTLLWENFTRKEEYLSKKLDRYQRFSYKFSNFDNIARPEVSEALMKSGLKVQYPEGQEFAICLTHDVDDIYPPMMHSIYSLLYGFKNRDARRAESRWQLWNRRGKPSPYINFKKIMHLEDEFGAKSSFYFLATDRDIRRFRYNIEDVENELGYIVDNGWEVGLHGGYYAYTSSEEMKREKKKLEESLGKEVWGYRNHYLRFKIPDTWESLAEAGFRYDCTLGYHDMMGFRNGLCHPFKPYNLINNRYINILELNLNIMDGTLFGCASSFEEAWNITKNLIEITRAHEGVLTILWHNSAFNCAFRRDWERLYHKILRYGKELNAWMACGIEICNWWQTNSLQNWEIADA
ncbi:MAG: hypothetical protein HPY61_14855 [Methanotrichaceae archaeon]|nr:hypothetical protein [Methanotrichaceae archaeon]